MRRSFALVAPPRRRRDAARAPASLGHDVAGDDGDEIRSWSMNVAIHCDWPRATTAGATHSHISAWNWATKRIISTASAPTRRRGRPPYHRVTTALTAKTLTPGINAQGVQWPTSARAANAKQAEPIRTRASATLHAATPNHCVTGCAVPGQWASTLTRMLMPAKSPAIP